MVGLRFLISDRWHLAVGVVLRKQGVSVLRKQGVTVLRKQGVTVLRKQGVTLRVTLGGSMPTRIEVIAAKPNFCLAGNVELVIWMGGSGTRHWTGSWTIRSSRILRNNPIVGRTPTLAVTLSRFPAGV